jgi:hypothetical protein
VLHHSLTPQRFSELIDSGSLHKRVDHVADTLVQGFKPITQRFTQIQFIEALGPQQLLAPSRKEKAVSGEVNDSRRDELIMSDPIANGLSTFR